MTDATNGHAADITTRRLELLANGYEPIPVNGKRPTFTGWQKIPIDEANVRVWPRTLSSCTNTGARTRTTPTVDVDVKDADAADAIEGLIRERFGNGAGKLLRRIGMPPKRAFLFRTGEPFAKLLQDFTAPDGTEHRIEVLGDGQQVVVDGVHPDTHRPYDWTGGEPWTVPHGELPELTEASARGLLADATNLLVARGWAKKQAATVERDVGNHPADHMPLIAQLGTKLWGPGRFTGSDEWRFGERGSKSIDPRRGMWFDFEANVGGTVRDLMSMVAKLGAVGAETEAFPLHWHGEAPANETRSWLVQDVIPEVGSGLISGQWGTFKTFVALDIGHAVMTGEQFIGFDVVRRGGVLFIAREGGGEVAIRLQGIIEHRNKISRAPFAWTETCPPLVDADAAARLSAMARQVATRLKVEFDLPLALIVIDTIVTAAGYTKDGADNDTTTAHAVMSTMADLAREAKCFVFGIDHFGKNIDVGTRGASVKEGDADVILALLGDKTVAGGITNTRLALRKRRGGANGQEFPFKPRVVDMGVNQWGATETTLVMNWGTTTASPAAAADLWPTKALKLLRQTIMGLMVDRGTELAGDPPVRALELEVVRVAFYENYFTDGATPEARRAAKQKAFKRAVETAAEKELIATREVGDRAYVWLHPRTSDETM